MITNIKSNIKELEDYIGFPINRKEITLESKEPHDETFSYGLCQRFYGKENELKRAISSANKILAQLLQKRNDPAYTKQIEMFYSLIGNMYYLSGDLKYAIGYFMKSLSYNKNDISDWIGLLFSLRGLGKFGLFEKGIFKFNELCTMWSTYSKRELTQEVVIELIERMDGLSI